LAWDWRWRGRFTSWLRRKIWNEPFKWDTRNWHTWEGRELRVAKRRV